MRRARKSSACITLVLIGAAAVAGCSDDSTVSRRKQYATKAECLADWGDPAECEEEVVRHGDGSTTRYYWGGGHSSGGGWWGGGGGGTSGGSAHSVEHGGFGASGHAHAGGS